MAKLVIDIVSDTVCPWCYVGKRRLERALASVPASAEVRWHPFFLDLTLPEAGTDKLAHYNKKFGAARVSQMLPMMEKVGAADGIKFDYGGKIAATEASHALLSAALSHGGAALQDLMVESFFRFYFEERGNLGDVPALVALATSAGLPAVAVEAALAPPSRAAVRAEERQWRTAHAVSGVPHFVIARADGSGSPVELSGAQDPAAFVAAFRELLG